MSNRHLSRSVVLQTLFEADFDSGKDISARPELEKDLRRNAEEFAPGVGDFAFMKNLLDGVIKRREDIDRVIESAAPDWPIDKISPVDRNILRIGLYELLYADRKEVPPKVAINEAIELGKTYGGDASGKFINGVLGSVYREMGEPGKDQKSTKKPKEVPYEKMPIEQHVGAVVFAKKGEDVYLALVHDVFGHWTLSKGGVEDDEDIQVAAKREIKEELGLDIAIKEKLGDNEYVASHPEKGKTRKQVTYFLGESSFDEIQLGQSGGLDDAKWFKLAEIVNLNIYDDILPIVTKAINILVKKD